MLYVAPDLPQMYSGN